MESVYIETSVVSYLVARPNRDPVTAWRQQLTNEWWVEQRGQFACVISKEVIVEALEGDADMARKRMTALQGFPLLAGGLESAKLAADLPGRGLFPPNARADANHLANAQVLRRLENFLNERALHLPRVCTPEELMGI